MIKKKVLALFAAAIISFGFLTPSVSATTYIADTKTDPASSDACKNYKGNKESAAYKQICGTQKTEADAENVVKSILNTVFLWVGIIAVIVIIIGGIFYILSQGEPDKVRRAKNTIAAALIGLVVALLSFAIVNFVLDRMK